MTIKLIGKSLLALSLLSPFSYASAAQIPCPEAAKIQAAAPKLDAAEERQERYITYTSNFAFFENNHPWLVAAVVDAHNYQDALAKGRDKVAATTIKQTDYAIPAQQGVAYCIYGAGDVVAVTMNSPSRSIMLNLVK